MNVEYRRKAFIFMSRGGWFVLRIEPEMQHSLALGWLQLGCEGSTLTP